MTRALLLSLHLLVQWANAPAPQPTVASEVAPADGRRVLVFWPKDPSPCLDQGATQADVSGSLGRDVFVQPAEADVHLSTQTRSDEATVYLTLTDRNGAPLGTRTLRAESCAQLVPLLSFTLAFMLDFRVAEISRKRDVARQEATSTAAPTDGRHVEGTTPQAVHDTHTTPHVADTTPQAVHDRRAIPPVERSPRGVARPQGETPKRGDVLGGSAVFVGGLTQIGVAPTPLWGASGGVQVGLGLAWTAQLGAGYGRSAWVSRHEGRLQAAQLELEVGTCLRPTRARTWSVGACLGLSAAQLQVLARDYAQSPGARVWTGSLNPSVEAELPLADAPSIVARVGVGLRPQRLQWVGVRGDAAVLLFEPPLVQPRAWLGLRLRLD